MSPPDADELFVHSLFAQTVALGYSSSCGLFTQSEWEGFEYALDLYLYLYYGNGPGSPTAHVLGSGFITSRIAQFATNVQFQRAFFFPSLFYLYKDRLVFSYFLIPALSYPAHQNPSLRAAPQLRIILNGSPVSFYGVHGCPEIRPMGCSPSRRLSRHSKRC